MDDYAIHKKFTKRSRWVNREGETHREKESGAQTYKERERHNERKNKRQVQRE